jgi:high-affinity iron transporter
MLQALALTFREGLGAFLVVGVLMAYFRRVGADEVRAGVKRSMGLSVLTSMLAGLLFSQAENQALWEGALALGAAACVVALAVYLRRMWRRPHSATPLTSIGLYLIIVLLITRGGMEISLLLGTLIALVPAADVLFGTVFGTILAIAVTWLWARVASRPNRRLSGELTAVFLALLALLLIVDGVHEIAEANVLPYTDALHRMTEAFSSEGVYGQYGQYLLMVAPFLWWLVAIFWRHGKASAGGVAHLER